MIIEGQEYITGQFRGDGGENMVSHLYKGTFSDPGFPMCSRGWQRKWYYKNGKIKDYEYSIFRNNISNAGICKVCMKRALSKSPSVEIPSNLKKGHKV